jgi:hypothetical protein
MRTTFSEMRLLNDAPQKHDTSFILNGKEWGVGKTEGEREKEREILSVSEKGLRCGS